MPDRRVWKTALKYTAGIAALAVSVAAAWFLPGWYAGWQDTRLLGQTVLSQRENIQFLDTVSLDIAGRLQMVQQSDVFEWAENYTDNAQRVEELVQRSRKIMGEWCEAALFPDASLQCITTDHLYALDAVSLYLDQAVLPIYRMVYCVPGEFLITLFVDGGIDLIYYASVCGPQMFDVIASDLGYGSFSVMGQYLSEKYAPLFVDYEDVISEDEILKIMEKGDVFEEAARENLDCDFAAVCGAREAEMSREPGHAEVDADLTFEAFSGHAYRRIVAEESVDFDAAAGYAVMYGTERWLDCEADLATMYGHYLERFRSEEFYVIALECAQGSIEIPGYLYPASESAKNQ